LKIMVGLLLTFAGLTGYALQVPVPPRTVAETLPWLLIGFLSAWTGGILIGNGQVLPPDGIAPALHPQRTVGLVGTVAGALSAAVVVDRLGAWVPPSQGTPNELVVAIVAAVLAWAGGLLMGIGMRRFVRRRRAAR
jgi:hypothetical protein